MPAKPARLIYAKGGDTALVLFTSGTTSAPKIVSRSHNNICFGAERKIKNMSLNSQDRILHTFPFYSGISINDTVTILAAGGTVIFPESLVVEQLFDLIERTLPTCFYGSPVVFHSLTEYAEKSHMKCNCNSLRYIRTSGAAVTEELKARLNSIFGVPVYIAYGLTETENIACSINSPQGYKAGSVGVPFDIEVAILNATGRIAESSQIGEIIVRGTQVIKLYDNDDDQINIDSFYGDWFRTGDSGYLDEDGYLFVKGRVKEIINRGGEKVSPYEVEAAIAQHPDVLQVTVFPIPAGEGIEDVGAAIVLKEGTELFLKELRRFLKWKSYVI